MSASILHLAELGYRLFPCVPGGKVPLAEAVPNGRNGATSDEEALLEWLGKYPNANWGLVTDDLLVVDIDGKDNPWPEDQAKAASLLDAGAMAITGRGGRHIFFRRDPAKAWRSTAGKLAQGVDTRSAGGYVVLAGSVVPGGKYEWVEGMALGEPAGDLPLPPDWLVCQLDQAASGGRVTVQDGTTQGGENFIGKGRRNHALASLAGTMRRAGMGLSEIRAALLETNLWRCVPPLDEGEVERIAESVARYAPDEVTVALAEGTGLDDPFGGDVVENEDPGEFPLELLEDLPGFLGQFVDWAERSCHRHQPVLALAAGLALQGVLAARKVKDPRGTRPNLYILGTAPSGAGKEHARSLAKSILTAVSNERTAMDSGDSRETPRQRRQREEETKRDSDLAGVHFTEGFASHAGANATIVARPANLFLLDEFGRFLSAINNPKAPPYLVQIVSVLLKLYSSSGGTYQTDSYADSDRVQTIDQPGAGMYATSVPESVFESFSYEAITGGLLSRLLVVEGDPKPKRNPGGVEEKIPETILEHARKWVRFHAGAFFPVAPDPMVVPMSDEAKEVFQAFADEIDELVTPATTSGGKIDLGNYSAIWTRAEEKARKIALVLACCQGVEGVQIGKKEADYGVQMVKYLTRKLLWLASRLISAGPFDQVRRRIFNLVLDAKEEGVHPAEVVRNTQDIPKRFREDALANLLDGGFVVKQTIKDGIKRGRPANRLIHWRFAKKVED
jgi:hypothetical protein